MSHSKTPTFTITCSRVVKINLEGIASLAVVSLRWFTEYLMSQWPLFWSSQCRQHLYSSLGFFFFLAPSQCLELPFYTRLNDFEPEAITSVPAHNKAGTLSISSNSFSSIQPMWLTHSCVGEQHLQPAYICYARPDCSQDADSCKCWPINQLNKVKLSSTL